MKKLIITCTAIVLTALLFSCKKGEDDPAVSLMSRKARVEGDWKLQEGSINIGIKDSIGVYGALLYKLTEDGYTRDEVGRGAHFEEDFSLMVSFTKKGEVIITQKMDSLNFEASGSWDFESKVGENKNKEMITIQLRSISGGSVFYRSFNKAQTNFTYKIKELRRKKMVLVCEEEMVELDRVAGVYVTAEYTFVQ